jgi:hypothetical protein
VPAMPPTIIQIMIDSSDMLSSFLETIYITSLTWEKVETTLTKVLINIKVR